MQKEFFSIVKEKNKAGATIFLSSHILTEIQRYCQKAAMIREGTVILEDEVSNICRTSAKRVTISGISSLDLMSLDKKTFLPDFRCPVSVMKRIPSAFYTREKFRLCCGPWKISL